MWSTSDIESRANFAEVPGAVTNDREDMVFTQAGREPVAIESLADFESLLIGVRV